MSIQSAGREFRANGMVELPIGPNKLFFSRAKGWKARAIEQWQVGFIFYAAEGPPRSILAGNSGLYANARPDIVGPWDNPKGNVQWTGQNGSFFGEGAYATYQDPQCTQRVGADALFNLQTSCTLQALAVVVPQSTPGAIQVSQGRYGIPLLQNPLPGKQGNLGSMTMKSFGRWSFDANISKSFRIAETVRLQLRIDALNAFNHATPADPTGLTGGGSSFTDNFGQITNKTGSRTFQAKVRLDY